MQSAAAHARRRRGPAVAVFRGISRRFGHAATDRQDAYLTADQIEEAEAHNAFATECSRAVRQGVTSYRALSQRLQDFCGLAERCFNIASEEPKIEDRQFCLSLNSQPLLPKEDAKAFLGGSLPSSVAKEAPHVMRRNMTRAYDELLQARKDIVYIGEDVQHGGYYRVTEGLHRKHGLRVADFPPDETSLLGMAIGYAQAGLLPIVELPYAKYLDCGADMFFEAVILNWLSAGKQPCGMVIRLQGFDKGVFGGNFHTHNSLNLPPGLDVVAYSNGEDYVKGLRHAVAQASAGRVVMLVDSTDLLNRRHLFEKDNAWMKPYPADRSEIMAFDDVRKYGQGDRLLIVTYGNGVPTALRAQRLLEQDHGINDVVVLDAPYLSNVPAGLEEALRGFAGGVLFADVCKMGQHPHAGFVVNLQERGLLPARWRSVAAAATYNPLGNTVTFLHEDDIVKGALAVLG